MSTLDEFFAAQETVLNIAFSLKAKANAYETIGQFELSEQFMKQSEALIKACDKMRDSFTLAVKREMK